MVVHSFGWLVHSFGWLVGGRGKKSRAVREDRKLEMENPARKELSSKVEKSDTETRSTASEGVAQRIKRRTNDAWGGGCRYVR